MQETMNLWKVCRTSSTCMNLTLHDVDGGYRKRQCEIETEKCSDVLQLSSGPSQDTAECSENSKNSKIRMQTSPQATRMFYRRRMVMSKRTIDRKCTRGRREKRDSF